MAAEQGYLPALTNLGRIYNYGFGHGGLSSPQDYEQAVKWYRLSAEQGDANSQNKLGTRYRKGQGVPQDYVQAVKWYRMAAEQGDTIAQTNLGSMYDKGRGVPQDYVLAHMWENLASAGGNEIGREFRDSIAAKMTPAQIAQAQQLARDWKPTPPK